MLRKLGVACVVVFMTNYDPIVQMLTVMAVIGMALVAQLVRGGGLRVCGCVSQLVGWGPGMCVCVALLVTEVMGTCPMLSHFFEGLKKGFYRVSKRCPGLCGGRGGRGATFKAFRMGVCPTCVPIPPLHPIAL